MLFADASAAADSGGDATLHAVKPGFVPTSVAKGFSCTLKYLQALNPKPYDVVPREPNTP